MKLLSLTLSLLIMAFPALAAPLDPIILWPEGVPGEADLKLPDEKMELKGDYQIEILSNVSTPTLTIYPAEKPNGTSVLVCPGGGYNILASSHEGTEICEWLNSLGITAGLLKYRVPRREGLPKHHAALQDAQRAIGLMRNHSSEWKLDPTQIGIIGFSAGGHLAAMALCSDGSRTYEPNPKYDSESAIPDFAMLVYGAYLLDEDNRDLLSPELRVSESTPPVFLVVAHGDKTFVEGSARFYIEMRRHDRSCELHIFAKGGHGFGFKNTDEEIRQWPTLAEKWMVAEGFLKP